MECPKCKNPLAIEEGTDFNALACSYCGFRKYKFGIIQGENMKEDSRTTKDSKICKTDGCSKFKVKEKLCWKHYKKEFGQMPYKRKDGKRIESRVSRRAVADKKADIPINRESKVLQSKISTDGKESAYLAQLLYASELLDQQIKLALEEGAVDTKTMLDIRYRLGAVLRGTVA